MINTVPEGWKIHRQGDIVHFINGRAYKLSEWEMEGTPVIRLQNLTGSGKEYYYSNMKLPEKQYCNAGDLLYMWSATFGPHFWRGPKAIFHYHIWKVEPDEIHVTKPFLHQLLGYKTNEWLNHSNGMGILHITKGGMEDLLLTLPPLPEQKEIAVILSSVDNLIETTRAQIDKLKDLKTGMMQELLTKGIGSNGVPHTEFKDSPVGPIPAGWELVRCGSVCKKITDGEHLSPKFVGNGFPIVSAKDVRDYGIDLLGARFVSKPDFDKMLKRCNPEFGDVLIVSRGATIGKITLNTSNKRFALMGSVIVLKPTESILGEFLSIFIALPFVQQSMLQLSGSSAQQAIYLKDIKEMLIPVPPIEEQAVIARLIRSIDRRIKSVDKTLQALKKLKEALMQDLLTGKVRVKIDKKEKEQAAA